MISVEHLMEIQERLHNGDNPDDVFNDVYELGRADVIEELKSKLKKMKELRFRTGRAWFDFDAAIDCCIEIIEPMVDEQKGD